MRKRFVLLSALMLLSVASLFAQSEYKPKFFFGYSNLQAEGLPSKNDPDNVLSPGFIDRRSTLHGVNGEITLPIGDFGITGDMSFNRNKRSVRFTNGEQSSKTDVIYFVAGPSYAFRNSTRVEPFIRALGGGARTNFEVSSRRDFPAGAISSEFDTHSTDLAVMIGGGIDLRVNDKVRLRVFQIDYAPIFLSDRAINVLGRAGAIQTVDLEGQRQDNIRFSFGVNF